MKKFLTGLFFFILLQAQTLASDTVAPSLQLDLNQYKDYFKSSTDYQVNLKSRSDYRVSCNSSILGAVTGDVDNVILMSDYDENLEWNMESFIVKLKYETYTYLRIYKASKEIVNVVLNVNPMFENDKTIDLGLCKIEPYRGS